MKQRILLIDDSQRFYRLLMDGFGSYFIIDWAKDFGECQRQLKANNYHLILLDIVFDEIDQQKKTVEPTGFKILDAIKVSHPLIPVIIVTGEGVKDSIAYSRAAKAVKRGASAILIKWEYDVGQWLEIFRTAINEGDENLNKLRTEIEQNRHTEAGVLAMTKLAKVFKDQNIIEEARKLEEEAAQIQKTIEVKRNAKKQFWVERLTFQGIEIFDRIDWLTKPSVNIILGRNGYGKSCLLRLIAACLTDDTDVKSEWLKKEAMADFDLRGREKLPSKIELPFRSFENNVGHIPVLYFTPIGFVQMTGILE